MSTQMQSTRHKLADMALFSRLIALVVFIAFLPVSLILLFLIWIDC